MPPPWYDTMVGFSPLHLLFVIILKKGSKRENIIRGPNDTLGPVPDTKNSSLGPVPISIIDVWDWSHGYIFDIWDQIMGVIIWSQA